MPNASTTNNDNMRPLTIVADSNIASLKAFIDFVFNNNICHKTPFNIFDMDI